MPSIPIPDRPLEDSPVKLRPWKLDDASVRMAAGRDPAILRFTSVEKAPTHDQACRWIAGQEESFLNGTAAYFAVAVAPEDEAVGSVGLIQFDWENGRAEAGYWLLAPVRGRGIATSGLRLICSWAFEELPLERIELFTNTDNDSSMAVATKAGFGKEGLLRSYRRGRVGREDNLVYSRLRTDPVPSI